MAACGGAAPAGGAVRRVYVYLGVLSLSGGYNVHTYKSIAFFIIAEPFPICRAATACFVVAVGLAGGGGGGALASAVGSGFAMAAGGDGALAAGGAGTLVLSYIAAGGGGAFNGQEM